MHEREGLRIVLKGEFDIFGPKTPFRTIVLQIAKRFMDEDKWANFNQDVLKFENSSGVRLGSMISADFPDSPYRSATYKYLLRDYLCYYEAPTVIKTNNTVTGVKSTYNKMLCTSSIEVVAEWLGISVEEADRTYGARLSGVDEDNESDFYPYVKLYETKDHIRKVTRPRKDLDLGLSGTVVMPMFFLKRCVDLLYKKLQEDSYNVYFKKDNKQIRCVNTTFNTDIIKKYYADNEDFMRRGIEGMYNGDFMSGATIERGYIRVFELGSSVYDTPTRSINYARISGYEKADPDVTFIDIDLNSVMGSFSKALDLHNINAGDLVDMLNIYEIGSDRKALEKPGVSLLDIQTWAEGQETLMSTVFLRQLALFMLGNPQWFVGYTGKPIVYEAQEPVDLDELDFM